MKLCHYLAEIIDASAPLQYIIELALAGMVNGSEDKMSTPEKRQRLKEYDAAWRNVRFPVYTDFSVQVDATIQWVTSDGYVLARVLGNNTIEVTQFASPLRNVEGHTWTIAGEDMEIDILVCAVDSTQDLLIVADALQ